jgi:hypothetical protein
MDTISENELQIRDLTMAVAKWDESIKLANNISNVTDLINVKMSYSKAQAEWCNCYLRFNKVDEEDIHTVSGVFLVRTKTKNSDMDAIENEFKTILLSESSTKEQIKTARDAWIKCIIIYKTTRMDYLITDRWKIELSELLHTKKK